jgi:putative ribosome biogenesis GTPase RsgA
MTPLGIAYINNLESAKNIRKYKRNMKIKWDALYWNEGFSQRVTEGRGKTRILACGPLGIGKSRLINMMLERNIVCLLDVSNDPLLTRLTLDN